MAGTVILSPHHDDAVLSVWHVLAAPGDVSVLNVFAAVPPAGSLGWWDAETGASDPVSRARERRDEDRAALTLTGRSATNLDFFDAQYRREGQPIEPIAAAIAAAAPNASLLLAPAGLGTHVDHRLVRQAALALRSRGRRVALYADLPHATREGWPTWVTDRSRDNDAHEPSEAWSVAMNDSGVSLRELEPRIHVLEPAQAKSKLAALTEYRTQLPTLRARFWRGTRSEALRFEVVWPL